MASNALGSEIQSAQHLAAAAASGVKQVEAATQKLTQPEAIVAAPLGVDSQGKPLTAEDFHMQGTLSNLPLRPDETKGLNEWTNPKPTK